MDLDFKGFVKLSIKAIKQILLFLEQGYDYASACELAKKVKHPGYKGDPFFELAVRDEVPKFERWLEREIKRV